VLRTSSRLAPSLCPMTFRPPAAKTLDTSDRFLPPNRIACTRTSRVPGSSAACATGTSLGVSGSKRWDRGSGRFHDDQAASAGRHSARFPASTMHGRGLVRPTLPDATEPLTSLSRHPFDLRLTRLRGCCSVAVRSCVCRFVRVGDRESRLDRCYRVLVKRTRITSVRDAFHR